MTDPINTILQRGALLLSLFATYGITVGTPATALASVTYGTSYMNDWTGCECSGSSLTYTDDQITMLRSELASGNHTADFFFANSTVWASDLLEDKDFGGEDNLYGDNVDLFAFSGHGGATTNTWGQEYIAPFCDGGSSNTCLFKAETARFGERSGPYSTPHPGNLRYLILATCESVHTAPNDQWIQSFWYGLDAVMGYRGLSADSYTTDEVLADFASTSFNGSTDLKAGWFWAIEDWWVNDTGSIIVSGSSAAEASTRLNNIDAGWARRDPAIIHTYVDWAWHEG